MFTNCKGILLSAVLTIVCVNLLSSQEEITKSEKSINNRFTFFSYRGSNAIDIAVGSAIINGDYQDPEYKSYFRIGYKLHITSHLNINFTYSKYNLAFDEFYNEGFMSFDLNWELLLSPYRRFSPFLFAGGGYNASDNYLSTTTKTQGGAGIEVIITDRLGLKLYGEYNYTFSNELNGLIEVETDDTFIRMGFGINIYFGGNKKREALRKKLKTVINSNPIITKTKTQFLLLYNQN